MPTHVRRGAGCRTPRRAGTRASTCIRSLVCSWRSERRSSTLGLARPLQDLSSTRICEIASGTRRSTSSLVVTQATSSRLMRARARRASRDGAASTVSDGPIWHPSAGCRLADLRAAQAEVALRHGRHSEAIAHAELAAADSGRSSFARSPLRAARRTSHRGRSRHWRSYERAEAAATSESEVRDAKWGQLMCAIELELPRR